MRIPFPLVLLIAVRVCGSVVMPIGDCDETFNYWEPSRFILYGEGLQTWEYSPTYALRSWLFVWLYTAIAWIFSSILPSGATFFAVRGLAAAISAVGEWYAWSGVEFRFGKRASRVTFVCFMSSVGVAVAAPSFLPSSFAMTCFSFAAGSWMRFDVTKNFVHARNAISSVAAGAILGWPFAALVAVPIAIDILVASLRRSAVLRMCSCAAAVCAILSAAIIAVDRLYYCNFQFTPWNIVAYNIFGGEARGPELYGVEPWHFFARNLTLNFFMQFWIAILGIPLWAAFYGSRESILALKFTSPFILWFLFWTRIPHKEERFMAPAYCFLVIGCGVCLSAMMGCKPQSKQRKDSCGCGADHGKRSGTRLIVAAIITANLVFGIARAAALSKYYIGPTRSAWSLRNFDAGTRVCLGRSWHRFPSSYLLPARGTLRFVKTEFSGALPQPFQPVGSCGGLTFNDLNREEPNQSIPSVDVLRECDLFMDTIAAADEPLIDFSKWEIVPESTFSILDASQTTQLCRIVYIPGFSEACTVWNTHAVFKRK